MGRRRGDVGPGPAAASARGPVEVLAELTMESIYYDTREQDLMRSGACLRRRTGGDDAGWHLELPRGGETREEIQEPLRRRAPSKAVPKHLKLQVQVHARGRKLGPVAVVRTRRIVHRLLSKDGTLLAELCDDHVGAESPSADGSATLSSWRQWELDLIEGSHKLLAAADELLTAAGGKPSASGSSLARAVGAPATPPIEPEQQPSKKSPAGIEVRAHLRSQVEALQDYDPQVRCDVPDAVHRMRVTIRRLRSALATFGPLLDSASSEVLRAELKWLADVLGGARDAEVMRERLVALAGGQSLDPSPEGSTVGAAPGDLGKVLDARYVAAHAEVVRVLSSARYYRLLDALDLLVSSPPWTSTAAEPARKVLRGLLRRDWKRLARRVEATRGAATQVERDQALHEVRKAAKRLRYACEAVSARFGAAALALGKAAKELQEVLGEHQDSVVSRRLLQSLAERGVLNGDAGLVLGRLHLLEQQHAERSLSHFDVAWRAASDKRLRRWLDR